MYLLMCVVYAIVAIINGPFFHGVYWERETDTIIMRNVLWRHNFESENINIKLRISSTVSRQNEKRLSCF